MSSRIFTLKSTTLLCSYTAADDTDAAQYRSRAGKVRGAKLPQEYELVQFIVDIKNPHHTWNTSTPACRWAGVTCADHLHVTGLNWYMMALTGTPQWDSLPQTVYACNFYVNKLTGPFSTGILPTPLREIEIGRNEFMGNLDLQHLPHMLRILYCSANCFEGNVDLAHLPASLQHLSLNDNKFSGNINLTCLPSCMRNLIYLSSLPGSLLLVLSSPGSYAPWWPPLRTTGRATAGGHVVCVYRGCELAPLSPYML